MKKYKNYIRLTFSLALWTLFLTKWNFENAAAFDTIASFLSITTGFTIAALSIIATSPFSQSLYKFEAKNDNSKTLLHQLVDKFRNSTYIFIATIGCILIFKFFEPPRKLLFCVSTYQITLYDLVKTTVWYLTVCSFITFIELFDTFSKFVTKSASK